MCPDQFAVHLCVINSLLLSLHTANKVVEKTRPFKSHSGARETVIAGPRPYHNRIPYAPRSRRPSESRGRKLGGILSHSTRSMGSVISSPSGVRPKIDFMRISGQKEAIWNTLFSIFGRWRGPQTLRGPGKLSPLSPPSQWAWKGLLLNDCPVRPQSAISYSLGSCLLL